MRFLCPDAKAPAFHDDDIHGSLDLWPEIRCKALIRGLVKPWNSHWLTRLQRGNYIHGPGNIMRAGYTTSHQQGMYLFGERFTLSPRQVKIIQ